MNPVHDACSWTLISVPCFFHSTTPTTSQLLAIAGYQMISLSITSLKSASSGCCLHERTRSTFGICRTYNDWMYAFVKLKSGTAWSGPKQLTTICANKVCEMRDRDLWNNCEIRNLLKGCFCILVTAFYAASGFLKGLGVAQVCKVGDDAWQKQVFHHLFFQHFGTFRLATFVIWVCFYFLGICCGCQAQAVQGFADTSSAQEWFDQGGLGSGGCWLTQAGDHDDDDDGGGGDVNGDDDDDGRCVCLGEVMTTPMPCKWTLDALWIQDFVCFEILATLIKPGAWCWPNQIWSFRSSYGTTMLYDIQSVS